MREPVRTTKANVVVLQYLKLPNGRNFRNVHLYLSFAHFSRILHVIRTIEPNHDRYIVDNAKLHTFSSLTSQLTSVRKRLRTVNQKALQKITRRAKLPPRLDNFSCNLV